MQLHEYRQVYAMAAMGNTMISRLVSHTTVPGIKVCAREVGMIYVEGCITSTT